MEVGESALHKLERAQLKITTLEEFIRDREVQLSSYATRSRERRGSLRDALRMRRAGRSHDMMQMQPSASLERTVGLGTCVVVVRWWVYMCAYACMCVVL